MELLPRNDLYAHASALRTGGLPVLRTIFIKTCHTLLFRVNDTNIQYGSFEWRIAHERRPLPANLFLAELCEFTYNNIYIKSLYLCFEKLVNDG